MPKISPEKLAEVKERLLEQKQRLWQEVKDRLKSHIGDGYQEMLATARDEEDQASVSHLAETHLSLLGPKRLELEAIEEEVRDNPPREADTFFSMKQQFLIAGVIVLIVVLLVWI